MKKYITKSEKETLTLAKKLLNDTGSKNIFALIGDLGSGKTTFTKGISQSLGIKDTITSPTFNILKIYKIPSSRHKLTPIRYLCHIDAYRLKNFKDLEGLGINNYFNSFNTITIIEWADKIKRFLPKNTAFINFQVGNKENERIISIQKNIKTLKH